MGQKTNPIGLRLGINRSWDSVWFDEKNYASKLHEDIILRNYINNRLSHASISRIEISRTSKRVSVTIHTARPGIVIGRGGSEVETLKNEKAEILNNSLKCKTDLRNADRAIDSIQRALETVRDTTLTYTRM